MEKRIREKRFSLTPTVFESLWHLFIARGAERATDLSCKVKEAESVQKGLGR